MQTALRDLSPDACYSALAARDARFDGRFFVGVSTTGIYCRTVCPARTPRRDRCTFYPSQAAAEQAGFRPCLRCRPEMAPGLSSVDAGSRLAMRAADLMADRALAEDGVAGLAAQMGVSERHLRRVVEAAFGVSLVQLAQTQRLLLAKRLLTDTSLPIGEAAFAAGFSSLRRFNALWQERYGLTPSDLRRGRADASLPETLVCEVRFRPPFDWTALLRFIGTCSVAGVEYVLGDSYLRTAELGTARGWVRVQPIRGQNALRVELSASLAGGVLPILGRVRRLFDLYADPQAIAAHLGSLAAGNPGLRVPGAWDGWEVAARAVLGQQVSVQAASTLAGRLAAAFGETVQTPFPALMHLFPSAQTVAEAPAEAVARIGLPLSRAHALQALAQAVSDGKLSLSPGADADKPLPQLLALPGIGPWTAQYIAMRCLSWPDAFPHTDLGLRKARGMAAPADILAQAEAWRPWRAYAALHLWRTLEKTP